MASPAVLIIDDDEALRAILVRILARRFRVVAVESYAKAIEALLGDSFEVVVSDLDLGEGPDGLALLHEVADRWPKARRLLVAGAETDEQAGVARVNAVLSKPFTPVELLTRVVDLHQEGLGRDA